MTAIRSCACPPCGKAGFGPRKVLALQAHHVACKAVNMAQQRVGVLAKGQASNATDISAAKSVENSMPWLLLGDVILGL
jgi:hypothetical protein